MRKSGRTTAPYPSRLTTLLWAKAKECEALLRIYRCLRFGLYLTLYTDYMHPPPFFMCERFERWGPFARRAVARALRRGFRSTLKACAVLRLSRKRPLLRGKCLICEKAAAGWAVRALLIRYLPLPRRALLCGRKCAAALAFALYLPRLPRTLVPAPALLGRLRLTRHRAGDPRLNARPCRPGHPDLAPRPLSLAPLLPTEGRAGTGPPPPGDPHRSRKGAERVLVRRYLRRAPCRTVVLDARLALR